MKMFQRAAVVIGFLLIFELTFNVLFFRLFLKHIFNINFGYHAGNGERTRNALRQIKEGLIEDWSPRNHQISLEAYLEKIGEGLMVKEVNCLKALEGDEQELSKANAIESNGTKPVVMTNRELIDLADNCQDLVSHYGFLTDSLTQMERDFPLAFSILVYKDLPQMLNLLRAIYRPQNLYCIHADLKAGAEFHLALQAVARCLPNVFMSSRSFDVQWGEFTVLEPEIICMGDMWPNSTWKYYINLTGQEFPLRTNYEIVRILTAYNGSNDIAGAIPRSSERDRWKSFLPAPHNITLYKGAIHIVASRAFVDFVLHDSRAKDFLIWCKQTWIPDEHYFNSLNHNSHLKVPGSYKGEVTGYEFHSGKRSMNRYKNWVPRFSCLGGRVVRDICILNVLDLPRLHERRELFANKFHTDYSELALACLAESLHNRTRDQTLGRMGFNVEYYEQLNFVKYSL